MKFHDKYLELRDELWMVFEALVRTGAAFPELLGVSYPRGINPSWLNVDTEGNSWFYATALEKNPDYVLHKGEDLVVGANKLIFIDNNRHRHEIEPDILDLYWLSELLDNAN
ncbi:hypothetical protein HRH59_02325 [Rheinheimera sp. YQF-2]|uniref:Uncharacterized protein n=1 Tax=Rheinheimera lutimaris TaxID=2740584 RepID=A0A7Y5ANX7_9GAMM|nr:hypothetical protein [Rheinheimera lutimaris]NRQ41409.1 hypothetical protein [Rheinheimera lutimaris]